MATEKLTFTPCVNGDEKVFEVRFNGVDLGSLYMEIDGYYVYWPNFDRRGFWEPRTMRAITDEIDKMNKPWDRKVRKDLGRMSGANMPKWFAVIAVAVGVLASTLRSWWFWFLAALAVAAVLRYYGII